MNVATNKQKFSEISQFVFQYSHFVNQLEQILIKPPSARMNVSATLKHVFTNYWDQTCDPRVVDYWLMSNGPGKLISFLFAYIFIVYAGGMFMKNRKPMELRTPMLVYNVSMVVINFYFLIDSLIWIQFGYRLMEFRFPSPHDRSPQAMHIVNMFYYYQWTKFIDFFDTFFFVLRKKSKQLTVLHIYHHISVPIIGWVSSWVSTPISDQKRK